MGEQKVNSLKDKREKHRFVKHLLKDVQALEHMLDHGWFEKGITRIGAEQEMALVDIDTYKPVTIAMDVIKAMPDDEWLETELAQFNLEICMTPRTLKGKCFSRMKDEAVTRLNKIRKTLQQFNADLILTGILPTLRQAHLEKKYLTPKKRYFALIDSINDQLIGDTFELRLLGIDELLVKHDTPLLEACNTSFQVHLQVAPNHFVKMYNIAQALAAPVMAIAANSPIVFGRRLWHESRIALFQQALDTRTSHHHMRERSPRVNFGSGWLDQSILEIYREDIARFRVLLSGESKEDSIECISNGQVPKLKALQVHNSTVYRWNRPCYGISPNGKPHLRIENRVLPAGPTVIDEIANSALWIGAMMQMGRSIKDITKHISYADVRDNFGKAARYSMDSKFTWFNNQKITAKDLLTQELLPRAKEGLLKSGVDGSDVDYYLGIIEERTKVHQTGARWQLRAFTKLKEETNQDEALTCLTASMVKNQTGGEPVHNWSMPDLDDLQHYLPSELCVEEFMTTDIFTVQKDDIIELVAEMMDFRQIRYTPVEDTKGRLIGLVTGRQMIRYLMRSSKLNGRARVVADIMVTDPLTVAPHTTIMEAMKIMREHSIGCLPVVKDDELVGIITEMDYLRISGRLMERLERRKTKK